jgi:hypothetical protein
MITTSTILSLAAMAVAYQTNSGSGNLTNKDTVSGTNNVTISVLVNGTAKSPTGSAVNNLTNGQIYIIQDELGWGHQFVNQPYNTASNAWSGFVPESLANHLMTNLAAHTNLGVASEAMFSTQDFTHTNFVPNTNFWLKVAPEKTGIVIAHGSPLTSGIGGSAVTPRHVLNCNHAAFSAGQSLVFVDDHGAAVARTVTQSVYLGSNDVQVMLLNADLPATVHPFKVLPTSYTNQLPNAADGHLGSVGMNQDNWVFPKIITITPNPVGISALSDSTWGVWNKTIRGGDSGHPIMMLVGTNLVLLSHWWQTTAGPNYSANFAAINASLHYLSTNNAAGSDYQLQPADLSAFPSY